MAQSSTVRQIGPILSIDQLRAIAPFLLTRPYVGRSPVTPHRVEGETIEPHVSVPMANPTSPAEVAEADPADDPLEPCFRFQGFFVVPPNQTSPQASSPMLSLATSTAPASSSLLMTVASSSKSCSLNGTEPHVVLIPFVESKSFAPYGIPWRTPRYL